MSDCKHLEDPCYKEKSTKTPLDIGEDFRACLPFGAAIVLSNGKLSYIEPNLPAIPDGVYTQFTVQNGCIITAGQADISTYTSTPCAPIPNPCDCFNSSGTVSGGTVQISSSQPNLSRLDSSGRLLTTLSVMAGPGISVMGTGAIGNPLIITATGSSGSSISSGVYLISGDTALEVSGTGIATDPYIVEHKPHDLSTTFIKGMQFDVYGHLVSYTEPDAVDDTVTAVIAGAGISVDRNQRTGVVTVGLEKPVKPATGSYTIGDYTILLDDYNRIYSITNTSESSSGSSSASLTSFCRRLQNTSADVFTINMPVAGHLRITVDHQPPSVVDGDYDAYYLNVDGTSVPFIHIDNKRIVGLTDSSYSAGSHTIDYTHSHYSAGYITVDIVASV